MVALAMVWATTAHAQFVCGGSATGAEPQDGAGTNAAGAFGNFACGSDANASGNGSNNTATGISALASGNHSFNTATGAFADARGDSSVNTAAGADADAHGDGSVNTATGDLADAHGDFSANTVTGTSANASGNSSFNTAAGADANASGDSSRNSATGFSANAGGNSSSNVAVGDHADAHGDNAKNTAVGANAVATGNNSSAFGAGAQAAFVNSAAFGVGAKAMRANQQVFGTASNTYTLPGLTSAASAAAQSGPTQLVTTDASGNLAATPVANLGLASTADLGVVNQNIRKAYTGVAMALAMQSVTLLPNEKFAFSTNWGTFESENGAALNAAVRLYRNVQLQAGFAYGFRANTPGGHAGLRFGF